MRREQAVGLALHGDDDRPFAKLQSLLDGLGQPRADAGTGLQAVDDHLDIVLDLTVQRQVVGEVMNLAVDPCPYEARAGQFGEEVFIFALLTANDRRQHAIGGSRGQTRGFAPRSARASGRPRGGRSWDSAPGRPARRGRADNH